jgi:hypothetical protein
MALLKEVNFLNKTKMKKKEWYETTYELLEKYTFFCPIQRKERLAKWEENKKRLAKYKK